MPIILQVICAVILMAKEGTLKKRFKEWTLIGSLTASGLPAAIYALQNSLLQISYKNLDSLTFSYSIILFGDNLSSELKASCMAYFCLICNSSIM